MVTISQTRKLRPRGGYFPAVITTGRTTLCHACGWSSLGVSLGSWVAWTIVRRLPAPGPPPCCGVHRPGRLWALVFGVMGRAGHVALAVSAPWV